jgi:hypothetical protein
MKATMKVHDRQRRASSSAGFVYFTDPESSRDLALFSRFRQKNFYRYGSSYGPLK